MEIRLANEQDRLELADLLWWHASAEERASQPVDSFAADLATW